MDMLDNGIIHIPDETQLDGVRAHPGTKNGMQFKTCELFISGIFPSNVFRPPLTEES